MSVVEPLILQRHITGPVADVYKAWTQPAMLRRWLAPEPQWVEDVVLEPYPGGKFELTRIGSDLHRETVRGSVLEAQREHRLRLTWEHEGEFHQTLLTVQFNAPSASVTGLVLTQERFASDAARQRARGTWERCLDRLARLF